MSVSSTYLTIQRPQQENSELHQSSKCFDIFMNYSWPNMLFVSHSEDLTQDPPPYAYTYSIFNSSQQSPPSYADTLAIFNTSKLKNPSQPSEPLPTYTQALFFLKMSQLDNPSEKEIEERVISNLLNLIDKDTADL